MERRVYNLSGQVGSSGCYRATDTILVTLPLISSQANHSISGRRMHSLESFFIGTLTNGFSLFTPFACLAFYLIYMIYQSKSWLIYFVLKTAWIGPIIQSRVSAEPSITFLKPLHCVEPIVRIIKGVSRNHNVAILPCNCPVSCHVGSNSPSCITLSPWQWSWLVSQSAGVKTAKLKELFPYNAQSQTVV